jgi:hypothetical protein
LGEESGHAEWLLLHMHAGLRLAKVDIGLIRKVRM